MKFLLAIFISLFLFSCSNNNQENSNPLRDSFAKKDSLKQVVSKHNLDSIKKIDSIVAEIKKKMDSGKLLKRKLSEAEEDAPFTGAWGYGLFENEQSLVYLSCDYEMDFGSSEVECFFKDNVPVFAIRNRIKFGKDASGQIDSSVRLKTATETTYFSGNNILQQKTATFTNEAGWKKIPFQEALQEIISVNQKDLSISREWVK
jgi:hypothetical protein